MFPEESRPKGGDYLNPATGEVLSGRNVSSAKLSISPEVDHLSKYLMTTWKK